MAGLIGKRDERRYGRIARRKGLMGGDEGWRVVWEVQFYRQHTPNSLNQAMNGCIPNQFHYWLRLKGKSSVSFFESRRLDCQNRNGLVCGVGNPTEC